MPLLYRLITTTKEFNMNFSIGDTVVFNVNDIDFNVEYEDSFASPGVNSEMLRLVTKYEKHKITDIHQERGWYRVAGWWWKPEWLVNTEQVTNTNVKYAAIIRKMKSMQAKRKEKGYVF